MRASSFSELQDNALRQLHVEMKLPPDRIVVSDRWRRDFITGYRSRIHDRTHSDEEVLLRLLNLRKSKRLATPVRVEQK